MLRPTLGLLALLLASSPAAAQNSPQATDVTSADIQKFINALPRDRVSDRPIRVVDVTGDYRVGVYGVFRPKEIPGGANKHEVNTTEIYYMVEGVATLVTGGTLRPPGPPIPGSSTRSPGIDGGVSRRVNKGDVVIIPGHTPHWWSELETDIEYLIFRPDPDNRLPLK
jgi:mannose-6-phosphate isomerase-like protein (cupin superfamily)